MYNETGKVLKLKAIVESGDKCFQIGVGNTVEEIDTFHTISKVKDTNLFSVIEEFCGKCTSVTNRTSRFYFRGSDKAVPYYDTKTCEMKTFDPSADMTEEMGKELRQSPRNCIVFVLNKKSRVYMSRKLIAGHMPAATIDVSEDVKIVVFFTKYNNWSKGNKPDYIYLDGNDGKKQIKMGFLKTGPNKEYTTNALFEEVFEGEEFPVEVTKPANKPFNKKPFNKDNNRNNNRDKNTERPNPRKHNSTKVIDNFDFSTYGDGKPSEMRDNRRNNRGKKGNKKGRKQFDDYTM
jgi:hypothetical protein